MEFLLQADLDGELTPAEAARIGAHLSGCAHCTAMQADLLALSERLRNGVPQFEMPAGLEERIRGQLAIARSPDQPGARAGWLSLVARAKAGLRGRMAPSFAAGFAMAAAIGFAFVLPRTGTSPGDVIDDHIRALQPGHLMDVVSTDQHTVKPWFDGRVDFAPPVKDLAAARFPLLGGRLDYLESHPVAVLVYGRDKHLINLYVWPGSATPETGTHAGYNFQRWAQGGMVLWAVSDLNAEELGDFVRLWQAA